MDDDFPIPKEAVLHSDVVLPPPQRTTIQMNRGLREDVDEWQIVMREQLVRDTQILCEEAPGDVDAVVGIARSGLLPASLIAYDRHIPLWATSRVHGVVDPGHGFRLGSEFRGHDPLAVRKLLLIDDTVANGYEMAANEPLVKAFFPNAEVIRAVIYCSPKGAHQIDLCVRMYSGPHYLEWNWCNAGHGEQCGYDFDGILCHDCPIEEDDDGVRYQNFLKTARPLYLPKRRPVSLIISARHEKYRPLCEEWLARYGVRVERMVLRDWDYDPSIPFHEQVGTWKAHIFASTDLPIFAESDPEQARIINALSDRRVLCPALGRVLPPIARTTAIPRNCCG